MKRWNSPIPVVFLGTVISLCALPLAAQDAQPAASQSADQTQQTPQLQVSPTRALKDFEAAPNAEYQLGPGDEISLDFPGRPELATKRVVGPDGRITLPLAGSLEVSDKTRSQVSTMIANALSPYYQDLTVEVNIEKYGSNRVIILGNVEHPGVLYFDDTPTLLDVIARGGLMANSATATPTVGGTRDGIPERCAIYRGNDEVVWVNLKSLLKGGSSVADLRLKRNDVVFVPAQQQLFVSVLGSVQHPGAIPLTEDSTLISVIAQAGGPVDGAGKNVQIFNPATGKTVLVSYKSLLTSKGGDEIKLQSGDVIMIPQSGFYKATYVLDKISPIATIATFAAIAAAP